MTHLPHRKNGYQLLTGKGLEIGAFNQPAPVPEGCTIEYCDVQSKEAGVSFFPELDPDVIVDVDYICDLDKQGLSIFNDESFDFVIFNHVIEHIANPIKVIGELFRVVKTEGIIILSMPDKKYTFDKTRELTSFEHLFDEYSSDVCEVTDEHYLDFLINVHPELKDDSPEKIKEHVKGVKRRREHAHVWSSHSFVEFLNSCFGILKISANCLYHISGEETQLEYFSAWQKK